MLTTAIRPFSTLRSVIHKDYGIIGAGAAGMAAAIHARYEGFTVAVFESRKQNGGAFSHTPSIHNIPGHAIGISGASLSQSSIQQFEKLGGSFFSNTTIKKISKDEKGFLLQDQSGRIYKVSQVILATGVAYRKLNIESAKKLEGKGIFYEVDDTIVGEVWHQEFPLYIYGAGNSAGQAALFYSSMGAKVSLICRRSGLEATMSQYLIQRMKRFNIEIIPNSLVAEVKGKKRLSGISIQSLKTKEVTNVQTHHLFAIIGGEPSPLPELDWDKIATDVRGYVVVSGYNDSKSSFSTNIPGIYAAGDITSVGAGRILLAQAQGVSAFIESSRFFR